MDNELKKKYGLPTAIALVIGIVIGSGVFFKAEKILTATGGNLPLGILAWAIGGLIMIICAYMFSILATRYAHVNGLWTMPRRSWASATPITWAGSQRLSISRP